MAVLTGIRTVAAAAVVAGLFFTGRATEPSPRVPMQSAGFTVLAADFHVHGFPDGIAPWDAAREARRRGLDVIALTSHNSRFGWWMWTHAPRWLAPRDVLVLPGEELTGVGFHMALIGVAQVVDWRLGMRQAADAAHAQGAAAILAHPGTALRQTLTDDNLRELDGVEVAPLGRQRKRDSRPDAEEVYRRAVALRPRVAAIGSSDFHYLEPIGECRTYVFVRDSSAAGIIEALRSGRTVACDARGNVYGTVELSAVVAERCRADASRAPAGDSASARVGTFLIWMGLLALVLAGAPAT